MMWWIRLGVRSVVPSLALTVLACEQITGFADFTVENGAAGTSGSGAGTAGGTAGTGTGGMAGTGTGGTAGTGTGGTAGTGTGGTGGAAGTGTGGTAGAGGASGAAGGTGATGGTTSCPGTGGPTMVALPEGHCIDSTEVTRSHYQTWLSTNPSLSGQPSYCSWNDSYVPTCRWPPGTNGDHPVVCVDWCDAYAYCAGVGKRLCGRIGGGQNPDTEWNNPASSQWYTACSSGGLYTYPYGDTYEPATCNGGDSAILDTVPVGSMTDCHSSVAGYEGVYDLSGNAREWEDSCNESTGDSDECLTRGGSSGVNDKSSILACQNRSKSTRNARWPGCGFRCCSPWD
jgi:formylglycine-generating enzyme required for sulfatase activity